jgi:glycosyltransferase involved in cell wall biosynthesis
MTRIAMLIPTIEQIGGAERQLLLLAKALSARGWQVTIIALSGSAGASAKELTAAGVAYLSLKMRRGWIDPQGWRRYLAWHSANKPEVVHTHLPHATWFARCVRLIAPVRVLVDTLHTSNQGGLARRLAYRLTGGLTNRITCVSTSVANSALAAGIVSRRNLTILPNGVAVPETPPRRSETKSSAFRWLAVGRLAPVKDYPTLLRAFAALPGSPTLQIAGAGPEEQSLRQLAAELKIEDRTEFAGFQSDIQPLLAAAGAFVLSSLWEGLPISVLEASAAGLPVVATGGAGTSEAIQAGTTGLIVPVGDPAALAKAMAEVMAMPLDRRLRMGNSGCQFIQANFSLPVIVERWERLYAELLEEHPTTSRPG